MKTRTQFAKGYEAFEAKQDLMDLATRKNKMKYWPETAQKILDFQSDERLTGKEVIYRAIIQTATERHDKDRICVLETGNLKEALVAVDGKTRPAVVVRMLYNAPSGYGYKVHDENDSTLFF